VVVIGPDKKNTAKIGKRVCFNLIKRTVNVYCVYDANTTVENQLKTTKRQYECNSRQRPSHHLPLNTSYLSTDCAGCQTSRLGRHVCEPTPTTAVYCASDIILYRQSLASRRRSLILINRLQTNVIILDASLFTPEGQVRSMKLLILRDLVWTQV